jgi:hypothetical protein
LEKVRVRTFRNCLGSREMVEGEIWDLEEDWKRIGRGLEEDWKRIGRGLEEEKKTSRSELKFKIATAG